MNPLDRLVSIARRGDSITLKITPEDKGTTVLLIPSLAGRSPNDGDEATRNLVFALTFPHVVHVGEGELLSVELGKALDTLASDQASGYEALDALERRTSMVREATASAAKAAVKTPAKGKDGAKKVTVTPAGESDDTSVDAADDTASATETPTAAATTDAAPAANAVPSVFDAAD